MFRVFPIDVAEVVFSWIPMASALPKTASSSYAPELVLSCLHAPFSSSTLSSDSSRKEPECEYRFQ